MQVWSSLAPMSGVDCPVGQPITAGLGLREPLGCGSERSLLAAPGQFIWPKSEAQASCAGRGGRNA